MVNRIVDEACTNLPIFSLCRSVSFNKGLVHKTCPQSGGRGFVHCGHFSDKGILQMRTSVLFGTKNFRFFVIYLVSARTRGVNFVRTSFMDGPLILLIVKCGIIKVSSTVNKLDRFVLN